MHSITSDTQAHSIETRGVQAHSIIDATGNLSPIPIVKLKEILKKAAENAVLGIKTTDPGVARDLHDFCASTGNVYLGAEQFEDHHVHYVKKRTIRCEACSKTRMVVGGVAALAALAYTAPSVASGDPSGPVTLVFLAALAALPPLVVNNVRLLGELIRNARG